MTDTTMEKAAQEFVDDLRRLPILFYLAVTTCRGGGFFTLDYDRRDALNGVWLLMAGHGHEPPPKSPPYPLASPAFDVPALEREQLRQEVTDRFAELSALPGWEEIALVWYAEGDDRPRGLAGMDENDQEGGVCYWDTPVQMALFEHIMVGVYEF
ncbi:MAG: hypothetical protein N2C14_26095 [Planctomycetales bacterium]